MKVRSLKNISNILSQNYGLFRIYELYKLSQSDVDDKLEIYFGTFDKIIYNRNLLCKNKKNRNGMPNFMNTCVRISENIIGKLKEHGFSIEKYRERLDNCIKNIKNMLEKQRTRKNVNRKNRGKKKRISLIVEPLKVCFNLNFKSDDIIKMIQQYI